MFEKLILKTKRLSALAPHLIKITGRNKEAVHPKHLLKKEPWFLGELNNRDVVLDLGCGNGQNTLKAAKVSERIIGIDNNQKQIRMGINEQRRFKIKNLKFIIADLEKINLRYKNETFDIVLMLDVLEHLNNRKVILKKTHRILKRDGKLLLSVPNKNSSWKKRLKKAGLFYYTDPDHKIEYNKNEIKKELAEADFKIIKLMPVVYDTPWVGLIDIIGCFSFELYEKITLWREKMALKYPSESSGFRIVCRKVA